MEIVVAFRVGTSIKGNGTGRVWQWGVGVGGGRSQVGAGEVRAE